MTIWQAKTRWYPLEGLNHQRKSWHYLTLPPDDEDTKVPSPSPLIDYENFIMDIAVNKSCIDVFGCATMLTCLKALYRNGKAVRHIANHVLMKMSAFLQVETVCLKPSYESLDKFSKQKGAKRERNGKKLQRAKWLRWRKMDLNHWKMMIFNRRICRLIWVLVLSWFNFHCLKVGSFTFLHIYYLAKLLVAACVQVVIYQWTLIT